MFYYDDYNKLDNHDSSRFLKAVHKMILLESQVMNHAHDCNDRSMANFNYDIIYWQKSDKFEELAAFYK